ncbi:MAG: ribosome assembly RNA-binding protein YhbY [Thermodesulfobacteriota bacterium]
MESSTLTSKQVRYLRGLGHHLEPVVMLGREGVTDNLLKALAACLTARELIKVKLQQNCPLGKEEAAAALAEASGAAVVQILGKTILFYRRNPDLRQDKAIRLP